MQGPIIILGAGQAGVQIADSLRQENYTGRIILIGDEPYGPYQRPPLSKDFLAGTVTQDQLALRTPEMLAKKNIEFLPSTRAASVDLAARTVSLADGQALAFEGLAFATGCRARPLPVPGADLPGVFTLRGIDDTLRIAAALKTAQNVAVIGGGFIGLEIAATCRGFGKNVTVVETADRLMARAVSPVISQWFLEHHRKQGVRVVLEAKAVGIREQDGGTAGVELAGGEFIPADMVVIGIGIIQNSELAKEAGLDCKGGIVVDACARTSHPGVAAAGDCTVRLLPDGRSLALESVQNAMEQAKSAAAALMGRERPFTACPWFWSDQYEVKLQMAGLSAGYDRIVIRGSQEDGAFSAFYFRDGTMLGSDSVNQPKDHMATRRMLDKNLGPTPEQAADSAFNFQTLLK